MYLYAINSQIYSIQLIENPLIFIFLKRLNQLTKNNNTRKCSNIYFFIKERNQNEAICIFSNIERNFLFLMSQKNKKIGGLKRGMRKIHYMLAQKKNVIFIILTFDVYFFQSDHSCLIILKMIKIISQNTTKKNLRFFKYLFCQDKSKNEQIQIKEEKGEIMNREYAETDVPGLQQRMYSDLSQLQQQIIQKNQFDLSHPAIQPKMSSLSSYATIDNSMTQIDLGEVKIKSENEVFLSQVDPYNIPYHLDIKFDQIKQMSIIGHQQDSDRSQSNQNLMEINQSTFEEQGMKEIVNNQFGLKFSFHYSNIQNLRHITMSFMLFTAFLLPFSDTISQVLDCLNSIDKIQQEQIKEISQIKKKYMASALLSQPQFKYIV